MTDAMGADMMAEGEESAAEGASHGMEIPARQQAGEPTAQPYGRC
jgi:hypothetical protein